MPKINQQENRRCGTHDHNCDHCHKPIKKEKKVMVYCEWLMRRSNAKREYLGECRRLLAKMHVDCAVKAGKLVRVGCGGEHEFAPPERKDIDYAWAEKLAEKNETGWAKMSQDEHEIAVSSLIQENIMMPHRCNICGKDFHAGSLYVQTTIGGWPFDLEEHDAYFDFWVAGKDCGCAERIGIAPKDWSEDAPDA